MSGIAAIFERSGAPAGEARIAAMLGRLRRRGPDRGAHHVDGSASLAQAMFETTPEDAIDRQPLRSRTGARWIVADARVDNRRELLDLRADATRPASEVPDSELILWAYERWGEDCPARIVGDFAFAIWDGERRRLFCARDHLGVRQLYYHHDAASFRCATEMNGLFADERVTRRPDRRSIALYLASRYDERDETLYQGVHALPPGHALTATSTSIRRWAYWQPDPWRAISAAGEDDDAARFRDVFSEAVRCRLRANRPMAAHVSGGLDSSSVACEGERLRRAGLAGAPLLLVRSAFPGFDCDEVPYSQAVADHLELPIATCSPADEPDICRLSRPYPDLYFQPTLTMLDPHHDELRRRGVRAVLTGAGGDLLMQPLGYEAAHHLRQGRLAAALSAVDPGREPLAWASFRALAGRGLRAFAPRTAARLTRALRPAKARWPWLSGESAELVGAHLARREAEVRSLHPDRFTAELCHGMTHWPVLPAALHDRSGASHGLEFRHPFYDIRVVELLFSLPLEQRFTREQSKRVLRRAMGPTLPSKVRERSDKAEFSGYIGRVFLEDQRAALQRLFQASSLVEHGLVDARALRRLLEAPPGEQNALTVADVAAMELWLRSTLRRTLETHSLVPPEDRHEYA